MILYYFLEYLFYGSSYTTFMSFYYTFGYLSNGYSFIKWLTKRKNKQEVIVLTQRVEDDIVIVDND